MRRNRNESETAERAGPERAAADWFVALDSGEAGERDDAALAAWLDARPEHADALARCDAASALAAELRHDPSLAWAFDEAARLAERRRAAPVAAMPWYRRPALAWGIAGLSIVVAVVALAIRPSSPSSNVATADSAPSVERAARVSAPAVTSVSAEAELASVDPVVVLPGEIVVDARSIAVLPFSSDIGSGAPSRESATIARELYRDVIDQLTAVPGLYVVAGSSAAAYSAREMRPEQIAAQLGVRGVVEGRVVSSGGRVQVSLSFTDASDSHLVRDAFDRPIEEVATMQSEITSAVLVALAGTVANTEPPAITDEY